MEPQGLDPQIRTHLVLGRLTHYYAIMQTTILGFLGLATLAGFGAADGFALAVLTLAVSGYGILAGSAALTDLQNLVKDLDPITRGSHYGRGLERRDIGRLRTTSAALVGAVGLALLIALAL
ncbi:hypothetical protein [Roseivivax sp. CAU 1761]